MKLLFDQNLSFKLCDRQTGFYSEGNARIFNPKPRR